MFWNTDVFNFHIKWWWNHPKTHWCELLIHWHSSFHHHIISTHIFTSIGPYFSLTLWNIYHNNFTEENNLSSELVLIEYCSSFALWFLNMPSHRDIHIHIRYLLIICDHPFTLWTAEVHCEETREESLFLCPLICIHTIISPSLSLSFWSLLRPSTPTAVHTDL